MERAPGSVFRVCLGGLLGGALCASAAACSGGGSNARPSPALASTREAQDDFRSIATRWSDYPPERRPELAPDIERFLARHGADDRARVARVYLAWIELGRGRIAEARRAVEPVREGPPGAAQDAAQVVLAAALRREGKSREALALLEPLRGKLVDTDDRSLFSEELVRALVEVRRFEDAMSAMLDWAEQAPPTDREEVVASVEALIRGTPVQALEAGLTVLRQEDSGSGSLQHTTRREARSWLEEAVRARLAQVALTTRDPELARRLVESGGVRLGREETAGELSTLAATSTALPRVAGRAVGVVLDVTDDLSRRRSAEVVAGMTRALGLPASAAREDAVHLLTRDAEEQGDVARALAGLAGDGASILVAGVTDDAAIAARVFAERARLPVMILRKPPAIDGTRFSFVIGPDAQAEYEAAELALRSAGAHSPARVGPGGAACDAIAVTAGGPRFPVADWKRAAADALVLFGDPDCTRDAVAEATQGGLSPALILGLESAAVRDVAGKKYALAAGEFPFDVHPLRADERVWIERWGAAPSWYEALGHDAAVLAAAVLSGFPLERVDDLATVDRLHLRARDGLAQAVADLWSTRSTGFGGGSVLPRDIGVVEVTSAGKPVP